MKKALLKYVEVARTTLRSQWAYVWDQLLSMVHLLILLFVLVALWKATYASTPSSAFAGYTLAEVVWYLVCTEAIILSLPRIHSVIDAEVKDGDLALRLNKPYSYLLFHYSAYVGQGLWRLFLNLTFGGTLVYLLVGGFPFRWEGAPVLLLIYLTTSAFHFFYAATIGLGAFWMEDVTGLWLLLDRMKWLLGGFLLPVELYPSPVKELVELLPFRHMIGGPARLFVKFAWADAGQLLVQQGIWLVVFGLICMSVYRLGVRRVDINGG